MKIEHDQSRFEQIVRGKIRQNLRKYVTHGEMIGRKGRDLVSIPMPQLDVPHFRYGKNGSGGVGQGEGEDGTPIGPGGESPATAPARPAAIPAATSSKSSLAGGTGRRSSATSWSCRASSPRAKPTSTQEKARYTSIRRSGPESLRHFKRTYKEALRRQISSNSYDPERPLVVPIREDKRYRAWTRRRQPEANAVVIYMMDVSGSMTDEQKQIVRTEAFWIDTWLQEPVRRASKRATSSTTPRPRKSTKTRSITPAKAAARGSVRPTKCAPS